MTDGRTKFEVRQEILTLLGANETRMSALTARSLNSLHFYLTGEMVAPPYQIYSERFEVTKADIAESVAVEMGFVDWCERLDHQTHVPEFRKDELIEILERMEEEDDSRAGEQGYLDSVES